MGASSRVARVAIEVAPPQFVNIMKFTRKNMLDTIYEDQVKDHTINNRIGSFSNSKSSSSSSIMSNYFSS
ncbi:unnamed protein product [Amaranthus hypochondriacus]